MKYTFYSYVLTGGDAPPGDAGRPVAVLHELLPLLLMMMIDDDEDDHTDRLHVIDANGGDDCARDDVCCL
jgi:hypothetical protein